MKTTIFKKNGTTIKSFIPLSLLAGAGFLLIYGNQTAEAQLVATDLFNGSTWANGGAGWTGDWAANGSSAPALTSGLTYSTLQTSGQAIALLPSYLTMPTRTLATVPNTGTLWFSWVQNLTGSYLDQINLSYNGEMILGVSQNGSSNFQLAGKDGSYSQSSSVSVLGTHFIAASITYDGGAAGTLSLYVDPTGLGAGVSPSSAAATVTFIDPNYGSTALPVNTVQLASGGDMTFGDLRIGNNWAAVSPITIVPEPSFLGLCLGALGGLLAFRRRA